MDYGDHYRAIYLKGLAGEKPELPVAWADLEAAAEEAMPEASADYVYATAGTGETYRENREAFERFRIVPRMLRDVAERDLTTEILGQTLPAPVLLAPVGVQTLVHPDGERATARAAATLGLPMVISTASDTSMEDIAEASGEGPRWYQFYWPADQGIARSLVDRAEASGCSAIVVTADNYIPGWKPRDLQRAELPFIKGVGVAQFFTDPVFLSALEKTPEEDLGAAVGHYLGVYVNPSLTWNDLERLRSWTSLPILVKGILHPDDAAEARERGVDGIVVSNHGGRQVDGAIASIDALGPIADEVGSDLAILLDSGVRSGSDAFRALALGADAVLLGRPWLWGLALAGEAGVEEVLRRFLAELDLTMALTGYTRPSELGPEALHRHPLG
ncbi:MAG: lactate 2-monooxygenase [Solirubrobacterales bacterium]|jgi:isopentenyl diphosphate isomerase/L-lactate dehydrogenase-like FMN-dependent dehydrogenase|nr:lactate 2-monooxygenase [Solirubrobacterales bacterium]